MKALIAEDSRLLRRWQAHILAQVGVTQIVETGSVRDALEQYTASPPDLAFVDLELPDGTGSDLVHELRWRGAACPIFLLVAHATQRRLLWQGMLAGGNDYLTKPVNPECLREKLSKFVAPGSLEPSLYREDAGLRAKSP